MTHHLELADTGTWDDRCRFDGRERPRVLAGRHDDDCDGTRTHADGTTSTCGGCLPCSQHHCGGRTADGHACSTHVTTGRFTCPACVHSVRTDLAEIVRLCADLPAEVEIRGVDSEAFHLNGPTADPDAWRQRGRHGHTYEPDARLGEQHPLWTLGIFERIICDELDLHPAAGAPTGRPTVAGTAAFIDSHLHRLAHQPWFDFADLARDLATCRAHLERVLHDGEQIERVAPCMDCGRQITRTMTDAGDWAYRCERCRVDLSEASYRLAVRAAHTAHADRLNAEDLAERIGVPLTTVREWTRTRRVGGTDAPALLGCCGTAHGRKLYRVADAVAIRDAGARRTREDKSA